VYVLCGMGGLSINDAMCFAKPVICSVADGTERRLVREGFNGYYFENGDQGSLNEVVVKLLGDSDKVTTFGVNSLEIIKNEVNIHTVLREYDNAFQYVLGQSLKNGRSV
jgi:glycosyltransferase involved in cell wall biosynthesis